MSVLIGDIILLFILYCKNMNRLKYLNISWNRLQNVRESVSILHKHTQHLNVLDLRHNPWFKVICDIVYD